jgi:two-component system, OmpR family, sensor kinase
VTLRRRVFAYMALAAVASCALTVLVAVVLVRHQVSARRLSAMRSQAQVLALAGGAPGARRAGDHVYRVGGGRPRRLRPAVAALVVADVPSGGPDQGTIDVAGRSLLYAVADSSGGRIVLVRPAKLAFGEWRPLLWSVVLAGLGGALLAAVLALALARRLTRPIDALSAATGRLAAGEADVAVPAQGSDELAGLGRSFNAMSEELQRSREAQRRFLESVSHELKTPLTSIRGYADALADEVVDPTEGAAVISAEAERLDRLVQDLLDLARLERAGFAVERDPIDLATVVDAAVDRHRPRARELAVALRGASDGDTRAVGDAGRLVQATSNLIENALRMTPPGGTVTVSAAAGEITVADTGPGLGEEELPRAFERFYLYERYRSERVVGTGLGLALVAELLDAMGGDVVASNRPGGGTVFRLTVPTATLLSPARSGGPPPCA